MERRQLQTLQHMLRRTDILNGFRDVACEIAAVQGVVLQQRDADARKRVKDFDRQL